MSLTGHLDVFPLEEVLRLLSRSYKTGCLRIDTPEQHGRVYVDSGSLSFATISSDDDFRRQLASSGLVSDEGLRSSEIGGRALAEVLHPGVNLHQLTDLVREEVVESLFRIRRPGRGQFVFNVDVNPRYRLDQSFDVELCIAEADRRAAEWADVELVIPNIDLPLRINGEAPNGEPVTLAPSTWRLIAAFEGTATVRGLSDRLGTSRFRAAKDLSGLIRAGLVVSASPAPPEEPALAASYAAPASAPYGDAAPWAPAPTQEPPAPAAADHDRSWWEEPYSSQTPPAPAAEAAPPPAEEPEPEAEPTLSNAFLDRVFSQLEDNPEGESAETEEQPAPDQGTLGYGFLKRRRMSSIGLDDV
jgi:hypothetical protein